MSITRNNRAFTLIELSIVIVIIGLIVAGIVAGQSLVQQAKLRTITSEVEKIRTALNTFRLQYNGLPGDITNAYAYWPSAGCNDTVGTLTSCNGDGDGIINRTGGDQRMEPLRAWQHLDLSNIYPTGLSGEAESSPYYVAKINVPPAPINSGVYYLMHHGQNLGQQGHAITLAGLSTLEAWWFAAATLSETTAIDRKVDDGLAGIGKVSGVDGGNVSANACSAPWNASSGTYASLQGDTVVCRIFFWLDSK